MGRGIEYSHYLGFPESNGINTEQVKGKIAKDNLQYLFEDGHLILQGNLFEKGETIIWTQNERTRET